MKAPSIYYKNEWKTLGDLISIEENIFFLFWYLPIKIKKIYKIFFIGKEGAAAINIKCKLPIRTNEERGYAYSKGMIRNISCDRICIAHEFNILST